MDYETARQFADSWGLLFLFALFFCFVGFVFRRGSRDVYEEHAKIPFKED